MAFSIRLSTITSTSSLPAVASRDLLAGQLVEQTITAHDDSISFFDGKSSAVDLDIGPDAECSGENPVIGVLRRLFLP